MKQKIRELLKKLARGPLKPVAYVVWQILTWICILGLKLKWWIIKAPRPTAHQQAMVREQVTFIYKSFERQSMAKRLYRNIQNYYPGARVIIADDSRRPLKLQGPGLTVIQMPFNSGLSRGLNLALAQVQTPFTVRLDDDELITPYSNFHGQLDFLLAHPEVDLVGVLHWDIPRHRDWRSNADGYKRFSMSNAPKALKIPHGTGIDDRHVVFGKVPNIFMVRTEKYRQIGYDDNIRMIDHHEFFYRAAGHIVSVLDQSCFVLHYHNPYKSFYQKCRDQIQGDLQYIQQKRIRMKHRAASNKKEE